MLRFGGVVCTVANPLFSTCPETFLRLAVPRGTPNPAVPGVTKTLRGGIADAAVRPRPTTTVAVPRFGGLGGPKFRFGGVVIRGTDVQLFQLPGAHIHP